MPKKSLPKKGTAEYNEQIADDPSDFIDDSEEEEAGQNITPKVAKTTTKAKNSAQKAAEKAVYWVRSWAAPWVGMTVAETVILATFQRHNCYKTKKQL
jgi:negative regulator of sigma E activity